MVGRGRRRARVPQAQTAARSLGTLKSALHGHQNKLSHTTPPPVNYRPYNSLVVSHVMGTPGLDYLFGPKDVVGFIKSQLGLQDQTKTLIVFKLKRVDVFATPIGGSTDRPAINMEVCSLVPVLADPATPSSAIVSYGKLFSGNDIGSLQDCAKLSYTFPMHMADIPLSQLAEFHFLEVAANTINAEVRFHVSWSTVGEATPTTNQI